MTQTFEPGAKAPRIRALAVGAALACCANLSFASLATLSIDAFVVSSNSGYVMATDSYQNHQVQALDAGGLGGAQQNSRTANDWNPGTNVTAQTTYASATSLLVQYVDNFNLTTAGFNLSASSALGGVYPVPTLPNYASALADLAGAFGLVDFNGNAIGGDITFQIYYTLDVQSPTGSPASQYAQVALALSAWDGDENYAPDADGLLSTSFSNGDSGPVQGVFTWTFNLADGSDVAGFSLSGAAIASTMVVPEPGALGLAALGVAGLGAAGRRRRSPAKAEAAAA